MNLSMKFAFLDTTHPSDSESHLLSKILYRGASGAFVIQVFGAGLGFINHVVIARILGLADYGAYALTLSWISVLSIFAVLGQSTGVVRALPKYIYEGDWAKVRGIKLASRYMVLASSAIIAVAGFIFIHFIQTNLGETLKLSLYMGFILLPILTQLQLSGELHRALKRPVSAGIFGNVIRPCLLLVAVLTISAGLHNHINAPLVIVLGTVAAAIALSISNWSLSKAWPTKAKVSPPTFEFKIWLAVGALLLLTDAIGLGLNRVDILILGSMLGDKEVGPYYAAVQLGALPYYWLNAVFVIMAPIIAESYSAGKFGLLNTILKRSSWILFIVTVMLCVPLTIFGRWALALFGPGFESAYVPLLIIMAGKLATAPIAMVGCLISMTKLIKHMPFLFGFGAMTNILLSILLIPHLGVRGAAIAAAAAPAAWMSVAVIVVLRQLKLNPTIFTFSKILKVRK